MDNYFKQCPPMMSDGRLFQDFRTATRRNEYAKYKLNIYRNDDYRLYLQQHGDELLNQEWNFLKENRSCKQIPCVFTFPTRMNPNDFQKELNSSNNVMKIPRRATFPQPFNDYRMTNTE